jgi:hypothetical protein
LAGCFLLAFLPESSEIILASGRSSGSLRLLSLPISFTQQWRVSKDILEAYGSGDCSGFTPDSLLNFFESKLNKYHLLRAKEIIFLEIFEIIFLAICG